MATTTKKRWQEWCGYMLGLTGNMKRHDEIDWLAVAIARIGGVADAAAKVGVSKQSIYTWLEQGLDKVAFGKVVKLGNAANIMPDQLMFRLGKFPTAPDVQAHQAQRKNGKPAK